MSANDDRVLAGYMLKQLENPSRKLTAWELQFIETTSEQFLQLGLLSEKQLAKLKLIYEEKS